MNSKKVILYLVLIFVLAFLIAFTWKNSLLLLLVLAVWVLLLHKFGWQKNDSLRFIIPGIIGPLFELVPVTGGTWTYNNPTIFGLPIWLPVAYGIAAVLVGRLLDNLQTLS